MEALMKHRAFCFEPTPEDLRTIRTWKLRIAAVYGAVLLLLIVLVARNPDRSETAKNSVTPAAAATAVATTGRAP
jgi:hypothetical protein